MWQKIFNQNMTMFEFFSCLTLLICGLLRSVTCAQVNETLKTIVTNSELSTPLELDTFFSIRRGKLEFSLKLPTVNSEAVIYVARTRKREIKDPYFHFLISLPEKSVKFFYNGTLDKEESFDIAPNNFENFWIDTADNYRSITLGHDNNTVLSYTFIEEIWLQKNDSLPYYSLRGSAEWQLWSNRLIMQDPDVNFGYYVAISTNSSSIPEPCPSTFYLHDTQNELRFLLKPFQDADCMSLYFTKTILTNAITAKTRLQYAGVELCRNSIVFRMKGKNSKVTDQRAGSDFIASDATSGFWVRIDKQKSTISIGHIVADEPMFQSNFKYAGVDLGSDSSSYVIIRGRGLWHVDTSTSSKSG